MALAKRACKKVTYRVFWFSTLKLVQHDNWFSTTIGSVLQTGPVPQLFQRASRSFYFAQEQS
jgi:hypothetical protein